MALLRGPCRTHLSHAILPTNARDSGTVIKAICRFCTSILTVTRLELRPLRASSRLHVSKLDCIIAGSRNAKDASFRGYRNFARLHPLQLRACLSFSRNRNKQTFR